jgi:hypothetical protein
MKQIGLGAAIHYLCGGSEEDPSKYYGKIIETAFLDEENNEFRIGFDEGVKISIWDDGQSCCEHRYMRTDDDPNDLVGNKLLSIETKETKETEDKYNVHEIVFLEIKTDKSSIVFSNHNEHNGYYGGFGLTITEEKTETHPVDEITDGDWWNSTARDTYVHKYEELTKLGLNKDDAIDFLSDCYSATASCYGG